MCPLSHATNNHKRCRTCWQDWCFHKTNWSSWLRQGKTTSILCPFVSFRGSIAGVTSGKDRDRCQESLLHVLITWCLQHQLMTRGGVFFFVKNTYKTLLFGVIWIRFYRWRRFQDQQLWSNSKIQQCQKFVYLHMLVYQLAYGKLLSLFCLKLPFPRAYQQRAICAICGGLLYV